MELGPVQAWEFFRAERERERGGESLSTEAAKSEWNRLTLIQREPFLAQGKPLFLVSLLSRRCSDAEVSSLEPSVPRFFFSAPN